MNLNCFTESCNLDWQAHNGASALILACEQLCPHHSPEIPTHPQTPDVIRILLENDAAVSGDIWHTSLRIKSSLQQYPALGALKESRRRMLVTAVSKHVSPLTNTDRKSLIRHTSQVLCSRSLLVLKTKNMVGGGLYISCLILILPAKTIHNLKLLPLFLYVHESSATNFWVLSDAWCFFFYLAGWSLQRW